MSPPDLSIQLAQRLAANEKKTRDRAVRRLRGYLSARSGGFTEDEFSKIWKGLFYCMWMQDKPLLQEELAHTISQLIHTLHTRQSQQLFLRSFWQTLNREWNGIDRLRLDKFYTLTRLVLRQSVELVRKAQWEESIVGEFLSLLAQEVLQGTATRGVQLHLIDIYLDELARVGATELPADLNLTLIEPFCKMAAETKDSILLQAVMSGIFQTILDQAPFAIEDLMKEVKETSAELLRELSKSGQNSVDDTEDIGPVLQFDYIALADRLFALASKTCTPAHNRKRLYRFVKQFRDLAEGVFPQDDFPEEVSTDEDDDEYSSWRFRRRQKRIQAREGQVLDPSEDGAENTKRKRQKDISNSTESVSPPPKKKKRKQRKVEEPSHPEMNGDAIKDTITTATELPQASESHTCFSMAERVKLKKRRRRGLITLGLSALSSRAGLLTRRRWVLQQRGRSRRALLIASDMKTLEVPVMQQKMLGAAVSNQKIGGAAVSNQKIGGAAVSTQKTGGAAVSTQKTGGAAVSTQKTGGAAVTTQKTGGAAVTTQKTGGAAVTTQKTGGAAVTTQKTGGAAVTTQKTGGAAVTTQKTGGAAVTTQKTGGAAGSTQKTGGAAVTTQKTGGAVMQKNKRVNKQTAASTETTPVNLHKAKGAEMPKKKARAAKTQPGTTPCEDFVSFCSTDAPKPVFVKTAKSKGRQVRIKINSQSKKVTFSLNKNMTAEFKRTDRSLLVSPTGTARVPFNPEQKPQHGVLKTPIKSPVTRPRAKDFF
ncbi:ribosomal RNA processing protein 1 homolog A-like [Pelobates fuscus]|uniref:ribosomal RNA processing protein 1 homolog A-like n=1 Tax=Pelobates fuscus TaxID=191477 RepID=UPI002FE49442